MITLRNRFRSGWGFAVISALLLGGCGPAADHDGGATAARGSSCAAPAGARGLAGLTGAPACVTDEFRQPTPPPVTRKVDLLFVMDNSQSMHRHWQLVAQKIGRLIRELPAGQDMRFAVIIGSIEKNTGVLFSAPGVPKVLDGTKLTAEQISAALAKTFAEALKEKNVDWIGAGEALVYSTHYAATRNAKAIQAQGFFRPDAGLDLIFMSDDADESYPYPTKQFWDLPPKCNWSHHERMRRAYHLPRGIDVDSTFAALKRLKGDQPVLTNAFVNITRADILVDNKLGDKCIFDSPGLGFFQIVKKTDGVLYSIHGDKGEGLARAGKLLAARLELLHDFTLSKPAGLVDPATIAVSVDGVRAAHTYDPATNVVHVENAGGAGSLVAIHHCEPSAAEWEISGFGATAGQTTATLAWDTGGTATDGKVLYGTDASALNDVATDSRSGTAHTVQVANLTPDTVYYFQAVSKDAEGREKRSEVISRRTRPDWSLANLSGQASRGSASVSWTTAEYPTFGRVAWGTSADELTNVSGEDAPAHGHMIVVSGLRPSTTYYFQAVARDEFGLEKRSEVIRLKTVNDWSIIGFAGTAGRTSASLSWQTPEYPTASYLRYGLAPDALTGRVDAGAGAIPHAASVTGLTAGTTYYFQAVAADDLGVEKKSAVIALTTIPDWSLGELTLASTETSFTASFATSGYPTTGQIAWGASAEALDNVADTGQGDGHLATVTGLRPDTDYYVQAIAKDDLGEEKRGPVQKVRTQPIPLPVWAITDAAGNATTDSITVSWSTAAYPTRGTVRYGTSPEALTGTAEECAAATAHALTVAGLRPDTVYYFQISAADDRGQEQSSAVFAVRTQALPLPAWEITGFAGAPDVHSVALRWDTSAYATKGKVRYGTSADNLSRETEAEATAATSHGVTVSGLGAATTYYFQVVAGDDRGQEKASAVIAVTTARATPNWSIVGFDGTTTATSATLIWQTGAPAKGLLEIGLSPTDFSFRAVSVPSYNTSQILTVQGLSAGTTYYFRVTATDQDGGVVVSNVIAKTTKPSR